MSLSILVTKTSKAKFTSDTIELSLDASIRESHKMSSRITSFPVEEGSDITDHISNEPDELTMEGFITDSPVRYLSGLRDFIDDISGGSRLKTGFQLIEKLHTDKTPFTVVTGLKVYTDMVIVRLVVPRNPRTGQSLNFTADLKKIRTASSKTVAIQSDQVKDSPVGTADQAESTKNIGKQNTVPQDTATATKSSALYNLLESVGLF